MEEHDHESVFLKRPSERRRIGFFLSIVAAITIVVIGWSVTVLGEIKRGISASAQQANYALETASEIHEQTAESRAQVKDSAAIIKDMFDPLAKAIEQQEKMMEVVADEFIQTIEE
jgi:hypothetical protein